MMDSEDPDSREADLTLKTRPQQESGFFDLPAELRNQIYFEVLAEGEIEVDCARVHKKTSILRVCSQIRNEALQIFWTQNTFTINNTQDQVIQLEQFLHGAGTTHLHLLKGFLFHPRCPTRILEASQILRNVRRRGGSAAQAKAELQAKFGAQVGSDGDAIWHGFMGEEHRFVRRLVTVLLSEVSKHKIHVENVAELPTISQRTEAEITENCFMREVAMAFEGWVEHNGKPSDMIVHVGDSPRDT